MRYKKKQLPACTNCGNANMIEVKYCPRCGQVNHDLNVPVKHLVAEVLENTIHFDSKMYRTIKALLFRPGFLTAQFNEGKRVSYVAPVRLYIFISFIFFFLLSMNSSKNDQSTANERPKPVELKISFYTLTAQDLWRMSETQIDSVMAAHKIPLTAMNKYVARKLERLATAGKTEFKHLLLKNLSYMMFILMPFFALIVYQFYKKLNGYYIRTLVYSIHFHSFLFLILTLTIIYGWFFSSSVALIIAFAVTSIYLLISLKRLFAENWLRAFWKTFVIGLLYLISVLACFVGAGLGSLILL
jgi:hypothetical protein